MKALRALADPAKAKTLQGFFKTGPGEYGEGDRFLGVAVPQLRKLARASRDLSIEQCEGILKSPYNEERALALMLLCDRFRTEPEEVVRAYLRNLKAVNNWNLVDGSAPYILGAYLLTRDRARLDRLARSKRLWERRIAVVATLAFIRAGQLDDTFRLCALLKSDREDLMHKACGWMLREAGKKDRAALDAFLDEHAASLPRTALRYAIERHSPAERKAWLSRGRT